MGDLDMMGDTKRFLWRQIYRKRRLSCKGKATKKVVFAVFYKKSLNFFVLSRKRRTFALAKADFALATADAREVSKEKVSKREVRKKRSAQKEKRKWAMPAQLKIWTGEVLERLKRHAWKACKRQKRFGGSNPPLSAFLP